MAHTSPCAVPTDGLLHRNTPQNPTTNQALPLLPVGTGNGAAVRLMGGWEIPSPLSVRSREIYYDSLRPI